MNIFNQVKNDIILALEQLVKESKLPQGLSYNAITAEPPREKDHGDIATNAAMVLAKQASLQPRKLAEMLVELLSKLDYVNKIEIAGPGFINLTLSNITWQKSIIDILKSGKDYGNSNIGQGNKVNLEYVSVNPTGPMHIGHTRGAVFGDSLALLLIKCGYNVTKEYYINDAGSQITTLAKSAYLRYKEALGHQIEIAAGLYPGDYLIAVGDALKDTYGEELLDKSEDEWLPIVKEFAVSSMMALIKDDLAKLDIHHEVFTSELLLHKQNKINDAFNILKDQGLIYEGRLDPPKGKIPEDWEDREQTLFKTTLFGDDTDRPLKKSDGSWTYFGAELAYIKDKLDRGYNDLIMILGADHSGYVKRTQAAVKALSNNKASIDIKLCQLVNFMQAGQPIKMSKRAGTYITVNDVLDEVSKDIIRFMMLTRRNDMVMDFDIEKVREQSKDNPVFYVQYAHARAMSIIRNAHQELPQAMETLHNPSAISLKKLDSEDELELIRMIASWPRIVELAAIHHEVHRIAFYLQELAAAFHGLWNKGKENKQLRFINVNDIEQTTARLALVKAVSIVIASGLYIFNVQPVQEM